MLIDRAQDRRKLHGAASVPNVVCHIPGATPRVKWVQDMHAVGPEESHTCQSRKGVSFRVVDQSSLATGPTKLGKQGLHDRSHGDRLAAAYGSHNSEVCRGVS